MMKRCRVGKGAGTAMSAWAKSNVRDAHAAAARHATLATLPETRS
jgi:hypothetical protein